VPHPGAAIVRHFPAQRGEDGGGIHLSLVLDARPRAPPHLPTLNKWQHRACAQCGATQSTGMFGTKALFCAYTELLFCGECMSEDGSAGGAPCARPLPWRLVHDLDDAPAPVCRAAGEFIDSVWNLPVVALSAAAPRTLAMSPQLQRLGALRARVVDLQERITAAAAGRAAEGGGEEGAGALPSEALAPVAAAAARSPAAATALNAAAAILRRSLGPKLAFLGSAPELLPLSLIVPFASSGSKLLKRVTERLNEAAMRLAELAARLEAGGTLPAVAPEGEERGGGHVHFEEE
jgi:hypothetical protein